jgi:hypothetical protein
MRLYLVTNTVNLLHRWESFSKASKICLERKNSLVKQLIKNCSMIKRTKVVKKVFYKLFQV